MGDFSKLKHFTDKEPWGNPKLISQKLLELLDAWRSEVGVPFFVNYATQGKHVANWHGQGVAVDGTVDLAAPGCPAPLDLILSLTRYRFTGIGILPLARDARCKRPLGLHLDVRAESTLPNGSARRWVAVPGGKLIVQEEFSAATLRKYGLA